MLSDWGYSLQDFGSFPDEEQETFTMSTDLIVSEESYGVLMPGSVKHQMIAANMAGEQVNIGDLDRIRVPTGGATSWLVNTIEGEKAEKELTGIIVHVARRRAYWADPNPTGEQPDCSSNDCITGYGNPGGECGNCPFNEFGTARKQGGERGRGKACKESTLLFLLRPHLTLPEVVVVSPGSLKAVKQYRLKLPVPYFAALTKLKLVRKTSKDGHAYAEICPEYGGALSGEITERVRAYAATLEKLFASAKVEREDVDGDG